MRRATRRERQRTLRSEISIHALREESDKSVVVAACHVGISIHALREESDIAPCGCRCARAYFKSTLSVRRATLHALSP
ncbi:hypothetical protein BIFDEN_01535 [Bifidobacterium dentium ATCC 27678]|nr:hypothetical protein BIFDEN_01535 [Bifidobacterium dentium ATCC 27678]